ncbi:hypothetical protein MPC4_90148 [Methylocella tundrae]|uniref:Uncharacterized protein n=1 Tax=Methylocella tundrae TaxID=227605 RepID=A0A8B6MCB6_METTU|nr:hypothetical protein MPC4_90148 [Methylocella tundrae]
MLFDRHKNTALFARKIESFMDYDDLSKHDRAQWLAYSDDGLVWRREPGGFVHCDLHCW